MWKIKIFISKRVFSCIYSMIIKRIVFIYLHNCNSAYPWNDHYSLLLQIVWNALLHMWICKSTGDQKKALVFIVNDIVDDCGIARKTWGSLACSRMIIESLMQYYQKLSINASKYLVVRSLSLIVQHGAMLCVSIIAGFMCQFDEEWRPRCLVGLFCGLDYTKWLLVSTLRQHSKV